jgi:hypothetical protein
MNEKTYIVCWKRHEKHTLPMTKAFAEDVCAYCDGAWIKKVSTTRSNRLGTRLGVNCSFLLLEKHKRN